MFLLNRQAAIDKFTRHGEKKKKKKILKIWDEKKKFRRIKVNFCAKDRRRKKKEKKKNQGQEKLWMISSGGSWLSALISRRRDGAIYPTCYPQS